MTSTPSRTSRAGGRPRGERLVEPPPRGAALRAHEHRAEDRVEDQQPERRPEADPLADLQDRRELDDRDGDEEEEQEREHCSRQASAPGGAAQAAGAATSTPGRRSRPTISMSRWMCGCGVAQDELAPALAQPPGEHREVEHERRVGERQPAEVDGEVARGTRRGRATAARRRRLCVARSSSPDTRSRNRCSSNETMRRNLAKRSGITPVSVLHSGHGYRRRCRSRPDERHRSRAGTRLRRARPHLRDRASTARTCT